MIVNFFQKITYGVLLTMFLVAMPLSAHAQNAAAEAQKVASHFSAIKTMTGKFVQFSPKGEMTEGTFYLERPGKIRFDYSNSPVRVVADGRSVVINNRRLDTWDVYQLHQTPLKLLLEERIDLGGGRLQNVLLEANALTIVLTDPSLRGSHIRMIFDPKTYELRQWTVIDQKNQETTVQILDVREGVRFANNMFHIDYNHIAMKRRHR